jgi:hypothetical protein
LFNLIFKKIFKAVTDVVVGGEITAHHLLLRRLVAEANQAVSCVQAREIFSNSNHTCI